MLFRRAVFFLTVLLAWLEFVTAACAGTVSAYWDNVALDCIQQADHEPSMAARMLAILHTAMYDAWTAYDPIAAPSRANGILKRPPEEITDSNEIEAVSFAAHRTLVHLFPLMAPSIDAALTRLGYDLEDLGSADTSTPPGIGNVAAQAAIDPSANYASSSIRDVPAAMPDPTDDPNAWQLVQTYDGSRSIQKDSVGSQDQ